jgi:NADP-dependent 3-hydroxy acid dehydrogenase YdfG
VLGAGGGLGGAIASTLAAEGARVVLGDVDASALERSVQIIRAASGQALPLVWDLADLNSIEHHFAAIESKWGGVDLWASPGFPDTSNDMMCSGGSYAKDEKSFHGRVQT